MQIFTLVSKATLQTLEMVVFSTLFSTLLGFPLGILLCMTGPTGITPKKKLNAVISRVVNVLRSFPFI
ncbi:MAG: methionine ABC transporter permease, partial [Treponema sp.]|nr:methionine ABC transporter permease [Treponema sp.]